MKRIVLLVVTSLICTLAVQSPSLAASSLMPPSIVVIDTGIDATYAPLKGRITQEVCIMVQKLCPNKSDFMEGQGAATIDPKLATNGTFYHGTQMSAIVLQNSAANIIHIRIIGMNVDGSRAVSNVSVLERAFQWVVTNREKYNIVEVSISQVIKNTNSGANSCLANASVESSIKTLKANNVPTFAGVGNDSIYTNISFPACISDAIAIGATDPKSVKGEFPALYSNSSALLDFYILGRQAKAPLSATTTGVTVGTSNSTALFAAQWFNVKSKQPSLDFKSEYSYFASIATKVSTKVVSNVLVVPSS